MGGLKLNRRKQLVPVVVDNKTLTPCDIDKGKDIYGSYDIDTPFTFGGPCSLH